METAERRDTFAAQALRNKGIGVVTINPPAVETDMTEGRGFKKDKILDPEDIAEVMLAVHAVAACELLMLTGCVRRRACWSSTLAQTACRKT